MIILKNEYSPVSINASLVDVGIDANNVIDTTGEINGGFIPDTLYLPIKDGDKLLEQIKDIVTKIVTSNGYTHLYYGDEMSEEEIEKECPNVFPIPYKTSFDIVYSSNERTELQIWIEPQNPKDAEYLEDKLVVENLPIELDSHETKYLLNILTEVIYMNMSFERDTFI